MATDKTKSSQVKIRYDVTSSLFASQFIVNTSAEDLTINFSSGPMTNPTGGETILPVHTRIAMSTDGAKRLHAILGQVLAEVKEKQETAGTSKAQLPKIQ